MDLISHVTVLGGAASRATLVERCGRREVDLALRTGVLTRVARGRYALATASTAVKVAAAHSGVLALRSAAQRHGWGQRRVPRLPDVTFPRERRIDPRVRKVLVPHWLCLADGDVAKGVTTMRRTLVDCMRNLPLQDAVPICDSALRAGDVTPRELRAIARAMQGCGRARAIAVAVMATSRAANAFESTLRAIASTVPGLDVAAQAPVRTRDGRVLHPDLLDPRLGIVIEAEGFEWHGDRTQLTRDCARYNEFVAMGLVVLRFSWEQVIDTPTDVFRVLADAVRVVHQHADVTDGAEEV